MSIEQVRIVCRMRHLARTGVARAIREEAGIGLRELAGAIGSTPSAVSRWERGLRSPRPRAAIAWARALEAVDGDTGRSRR